MTTDFREIARCATWLGPNQPGINEDLGLPPYDPSVCPGGTAPEHARRSSAIRAGVARVGRGAAKRRRARAIRRRAGGAAGGPRPGSGGRTDPGGGRTARARLGDILDDLLGPA